VVLAAILLALTATAAFVPARRASRTDPAIVPRSDQGPRRSPRG